MPMDWFEPIRAYCERQGPGFWAEPANAVSNAAFLMAAAAAGWRARAARPPDIPGLALSGLVAVIGIGSFLFHTVAVYWAMLADVIPIALFIHAYLLLALHRLVGLALPAAAGVMLAFAVVNAGLTPTFEAATGLDIAALTNGSADYLPALLALVGIAGAVFWRGGPLSIVTGTRLAGIAALFCLSLAARSLDKAACAALPTGTHAVWHLLNAAVLYALVATAIAHRARTARPEATAPFLAARREFQQKDAASRAVGACARKDP